MDKFFFQSGLLLQENYTDNPDGLVYNHLKLTLKTQTDMKKSKEKTDNAWENITYFGESFIHYNPFLNRSSFNPLSPSYSFSSNSTTSSLSNTLSCLDSPVKQETQPKKKNKVEFYFLDKKNRNVDKACNHCKRSHLKCDLERPCQRCITTNKTNCEDVHHKRRGRPRLVKKHMKMN